MFSAPAKFLFSREEGGDNFRCVSSGPLTVAVAGYGSRYRMSVYKVPALPVFNCCSYRMSVYKVPALPVFNCCSYRMSVYLSSNTP